MDAIRTIPDAKAAMAYRGRSGPGSWRPRRHPRLAAAAAGAALLLAVPMPARAVDAVTEWTLEADRLGRGGANWRTIAIMHVAMHDAANAVQPRYARWAPPLPDEPSAVGADLEAALAGAAAQVLIDLHPSARAEVGRLFQSAIRRLPQGDAVRDGLLVGEAIGRSAVRRRAGDGYGRVRPFQGGDQPGQWGPIPADAGSNTTDAVPFLLASRSWPGSRPPPAPGSPAFLRDLEEVRLKGGEHAPARTSAETYAATYWAFQSSQRGFIRLGASLLDSDPLPGGLVDHARAMSQLATAMADAAIVTWAEKERYSYWRPVSAIRSGGPGMLPHPDWRPLIETPGHPEYPSGHSSDCYTGAGVLAGVFGPGITPVTYVAQSAMPGADGSVSAVGMGQHAQAGQLAAVERTFTGLGAIATECATSRIWAGAHFRSANEESRRLSDLIVSRALAAVPPLAPR